MYTIALSLFLGTLIGVLFGVFDVATPGWSIFWGLFITALAYGLASLYFRKAIGKQMAVIQETMTTGQKNLQNRMQMMQFKPGADPKQLMREMETASGKVLRTALDQTSLLEPFVRWVPLMNRQIATMRMQFHYQLKEFTKVDELLPQCLMLDPMSTSMKIAQLYRNKTPSADIRKAFDSAIRRFRYNQTVLPYSLMAWIYVQDHATAEQEARKATSPEARKAAEDRAAAASEAAYKLLLLACKDNEHDTLKRNRDKLANQRVHEFSNAGLSEQWYALYLEQPKMQQRRMMPRADGRPF